MNTTIDEFEEWYGNNDLIYSNDVKNMAFKAWKAGAQALLSQGEPVGKVTSKLGDICAFKSSQVNKGDLLYTAPPSTESLQYEVSAKIGKLQKDKAELIEYVEKLIYKINFIESHALNEKQRKIVKVIDIPQPQCMQE